MRVGPLPIRSRGCGHAEAARSRAIMRLRRLLPALAAILCVLCALAPQYATAEAVAGTEAKAGPSGLPDGRIYEQVSPKNKDGSEAGGSLAGTPPYIVAGIGGDEVAYFNSGPLGETPAGFDYFSIARRFPGGWQSHAAVSRGEGLQGAFRTNPQTGLGFSAEMRASVFGAPDVFVPEQEPSSPTPHLYRYSEDGTVQWIGKPAIADPPRFEGFYGSSTGQLAGASPSYDSIYYSFDGALTTAEEEPNPTLGGLSRVQEIEAMNESGEAPNSNSGFYEWHEGVLSYAGVLPNGHIDPYGASPAATVDATDYSAEALNNQVSEDGSKAFFVSPDPGSRSERPVELYVRETAPDGAQSTTLVSRDTLLPDVEGLPAPAPSGVVPGNGTKGDDGEGEFNAISSSYIYASPNGSRVFFESLDQLTSAAPAGATVKEYEFDTETNVLTYLPGVADLVDTCTGPCAPPTVHVLVSSHDGSDFLFVRDGQLELWNEGTITAIGPVASGNRGITLARASASGSVFVFQTKSPFPELKFNNGGGRDEQVYRYEVAGNTLSCLSCAPAGAVSTGNAALSHAYPKGNLGNTFLEITGNRGISEDGSRVFFDTPTPLVPQATNGVRNAYEWENGTLYLISTGVSTAESFFGDNSPSGNDVFFSTLEGLVPGDTDEAYDVYDARIPRPGDQLPPAAVPCEGAVCQGPPSVPQLLGTPASEAFNGPQNLMPLPRHQRSSQRPTRKQKLQRALKRCRRAHTHSRRKRRRCLAGARKRAGVKAALSLTRAHHKHRNGNHHHNGRGK